MSNETWTLSTGLVLPEPGVTLYLPQEPRVSSEGNAPSIAQRRTRPPPDVGRRAWDTYRRAHDNAVALLGEAGLLREHGMFARAFALACTALEEIGKSQVAADVYTGFLPHEPFEKAIRDHQFKSAYTTRSVLLLSLQPVLNDPKTAEQLFRRRNDALYVSPDNEVQDADFEHDATTMIRYCDEWLETIARTEAISERIGTRGFMK